MTQHWQGQLYAWINRAGALDSSTWAHNLLLLRGRVVVLAVNAHHQFHDPFGRLGLSLQSVCNDCSVGKVHVGGMVGSSAYCIGGTTELLDQIQRPYALPVVANTYRRV